MGERCPWSGALANPHRANAADCPGCGATVGATARHRYRVHERGQGKVVRTRDVGDFWGAPTPKDD